jgi:hypothetical protein
MGFDQAKKIKIIFQRGKKIFISMSSMLVVLQITFVLRTFIFQQYSINFLNSGKVWELRNRSYVAGNVYDIL